LNRAADTKADNHFNHPQIMNPKPAKNLSETPSEGLGPTVVTIGIRVRHDGNGDQLFLPVIAMKGAGTRVTFLLLQWGHGGLAVSCSTMVSILSKVSPHASQR
jgi:hypothetical protein